MPFSVVLVSTCRRSDLRPRPSENPHAGPCRRKLNCAATYAWSMRSPASTTAASSCCFLTRRTRAASWSPADSPAESARLLGSRRRVRRRHMPELGRRFGRAGIALRRADNSPRRRGCDGRSAVVRRVQLHRRERAEPRLGQRSIGARSVNLEDVDRCVARWLHETVGVLDADPLARQAPRARRRARRVGRGSPRRAPGSA